MDILYQGTVIGQSQSELNVGDIWVLDGVQYVVLYVDMYTSEVAIVRKV